ncbi:MAG: flavin reductase family protein [Clostridiales bacterium]|nr:flavin reductase family protein [Clostridiales bacterium]
MSQANESQWREISPADLSFNPFTWIDKEWMLVTAGNQEKHNTMTASWGGLGVLWKKYVSFVFVRPQRYSMEFLEHEDYYSLCFFDKQYRPALSYCGSHSGRDVDKDKETGLTALYDQAAPYYEQARIVFICRKMHGQFLDPNCFLDDTIDGEVYPTKDYHKMYVGEIVKALLKKD